MRSERWPLLAAVAFAILLGGAFFAVEMPPGAAASGQDIVAWVQAHQAALAVQGWLTAVAWLPGVFLVALVHQRLRGPSATVYLLGAGLSVSLLFVGVLLRLGLARHAHELEPHAARLIADIEAYWGPLLTISNVLQAGALAASARVGLLPGWFAPITLVFALQQAVETVTIVGSSGAIAPGGALNLIGAGLYFIWIVALGVAASTDQRRVLSGERLAPSLR